MRRINKKGVSLIVIVITVIVMIILAAAVIITMENTNIINKAKDAVNKTNEKNLKYQSELYEAELKLELREFGFRSVKFPQYAKDVYINAVKEGKTEEEAKELARYSFIGYNEDFRWNTKIHAPLSTKPYWTPEYKEVIRVVGIIETDHEGKTELNIDEKLLPKDLVASIKDYRKQMIEYSKGNLTEAEVVEFYENNEPLYSLLTKDPDGKYYSYIENGGVLRLPYYIEHWYIDINDGGHILLPDEQLPVKMAVLKMDDYAKEWNQTASYWNEITKVIVDENYTKLIANSMPPVTGDCKIILPNSIKKIERLAFRYVKVNTLVLPSSIETIESGAFLFSKNFITNLIIKKEKGSIPGEPWGLDTTKTTITWQPE